MFKNILLPVIIFFIVTGVSFSQTISGPAGTYSSKTTLSEPGPINLITPWTCDVGGPFTFTCPGPVTVTQTANSITFTWGENPTPQPIPPTPNQTGPLYTIVVFDKNTNLATADQLAVKTSSTIVNNLKALDSKFAFCDKSSPAFSDWIPSNITNFPALVVISIDPTTNRGTQLEAIECPANEAAIVAEIKRIGKK